MVRKEGLCGGEQLAHVYHILPQHAGIDTLPPQDRGYLTKQTMPRNVHLVGFAMVRLESSMQARIWSRTFSREVKVPRLSSVRYLLTRARFRPDSERQACLGVLYNTTRCVGSCKKAARLAIERKMPFLPFLRHPFPAQCPPDPRDAQRASGRA
jgi:hypothetical protein